MKKVLIFAYYWPPAGGVAVQRFLKFAKYLPQFGWEPIIITVANGSYPYEDASLQKDVSPLLRVYKTDTREPFELYNRLRGKKGKQMPLVMVGADKKKTLFQRLTEFVRANFFIPDARMGWRSYAVKQAEEILRSEKIDAIVTTGPPHSAHLIGLELKRKHGVKWLADFRDPWTNIFSNQYLPRMDFAKRKDKALETDVLQTADAVTVISPGMKQEFADRAKRLEVIYNGYDEQDFREDQRPKTEDRSSAFTIRYVGNLMSSQNCDAFWKTVSELKQQVRIELVGRVDAVVKESLAKHGLIGSVHYLDFVAHDEALQLMCSADLLLFIIPDVEGKELIMTGKVFEYLASCSEMISIGPPNGNAADALASSGRKPMLDYNNEVGMNAQLQAAFNYWQQTQHAFKYTTKDHLRFSRQMQTAELSALLNSL